MKTPRANVIRVRVAQIKDASEIARLAIELGYPSSPSQVRRRISKIMKDGTHVAYVAAGSDGRVVGWVHAFVYRLVESDPQAEIGGLVVNEDFRGRGIGKLLMNRAERWARSQGLKSVYLRSNVAREKAHSFYQRLGYRIIKTQHAFQKKL